MVKVIGPVFSLDAQGNLGDSLNNCLRINKNNVRHKTDPLPFKSAALIEINNFMRHTVWTWQHLTPNLKQDWDTWAQSYRPDGSGFNSFTSYYMRDLIGGQIPPLEP